MSQPPPLPPRRPDVSHLLKRRPPPPPPPPFPGQLLETTGGLFAQCAFPFSNLTRSSESSTTSTTIFRPHSNGRLALAWDAVVGESAGVCTECFKSFFVPLGLEEEFVQSSLNSTPLWQCDFSHPTLESHWNAVRQTRSLEPVIEYLTSLQLPDCPSTDSSSGIRYEFSPSLGEVSSIPIADNAFGLCGRCYHRQVSGSAFERHFVKREKTAVAPCSLSILAPVGGALSFAFFIASDRRDISHFLDIYKWAAYYCNPTAPKCPGLQPTAMPTVYYNFPSVPNFDFCEVCFRVTLLAYPHVKDIVRRNELGAGAEGTFSCDLTSVSSRYWEIQTQLLVSYTVKDPDMFTDFIRQLSVIPTCVGAEQVANRRWYTGTSEDTSQCTVCEDCHRQAIAKTTLYHHFSATAQLAPGNVICDFYSPRMRSLYATACANDDIKVLATGLRERWDAYVEWQTLQQRWDAQNARMEESIRFMNQMGWYNPVYSGIGNMTRRSGPEATMHLAIAGQMRYEAGQEDQREGSLFRSADAAKQKWLKLQ